MNSLCPHALVLHVSCAEQTWGAAGVEKSHRQDSKGQNVGGDRGDHVGTIAFFKCGGIDREAMQKGEEKVIFRACSHYASLQLTGATTCEPRKGWYIISGFSVSLPPRSSKK